MNFGLLCGWGCSLEGLEGLIGMDVFIRRAGGPGKAKGVCTYPAREEKFVNCKESNRLIK